jgi:hypothetical protein
VKNHKIAKNSTTTKAKDKISTDLESLQDSIFLMYGWLNLKTIKFCSVKLATDFYSQPSYLLGERASFLLFQGL